MEDQRKTTSKFLEGRAAFVWLTAVSSAVSPVPSDNDLLRSHVASVSPWPRWLSCKGELQVSVAVQGGSGRGAWEIPQFPAEMGWTQRRNKGTQRRMVTVPVTGLPDPRKSSRGRPHFRQLRPCMNNREQDAAHQSYYRQTLFCLYATEWGKTGKCSASKDNSV